MTFPSLTSTWHFLLRWQQSTRNTLPQTCGAVEVRRGQRAPLQEGEVVSTRVRPKGRRAGAGWLFEPTRLHQRCLHIVCSFRNCENIKKPMGEVIHNLSAIAHGVAHASEREGAGKWKHQQQEHVRDVFRRAPNCYGPWRILCAISSVKGSINMKTMPLRKQEVY